MSPPVGPRRFERPSLREAAGYVPGEQPESGEVIKLNTNENPYPPAPAVKTALTVFDLDRLRRYPQPTALDFRRVAAALHGVDAEAIIAANGSDELLRLAFATFVEPGETVGILTPSYSLYPVLAELHGARVAEVPLAEDWTPPGDVAARLNAARAKLVFVVNPHAPSGTLLAPGPVASLADAFEGVVVLDEAYVDFVDPASGYDSMPLVRSHDNVLVLRTLSKGYSLAGLRFGYGIGAPGVVEPMQTKTKDSYNTDVLSQVLAVAALESREYAQSTWRAVREERARLAARLADLGLPCEPSQANFLLARVPEGWAGLERPAAGGLYRRLKAAGILVRYFASAPLEGRLRITIGNPDENEQLLACIRHHAS